MGIIEEDEVPLIEAAMGTKTREEDSGEIRRREEEDDFRDGLAGQIYSILLILETV